MLNIGHRGAAAHYPENTLGGFLRAIEMGANGIELDVHCCKSGELVVMHDETVDRTTNGKGSVAKMNLSALEKLTISPGETVPALTAVIDRLGKKPYYFIEVKQPEDALAAAECIENYIKKGWKKEKLILISFAHDALLAVRRKFPHITMGMSVATWPKNGWATAKKMKAQYLLPKYTLCRPEFLAQARAREVKIVPWTVNHPSIIAVLKQWKIDGIISDYPDRL